MFENFGLKDVFSNVKKFIWLFVAIMIVFVSIGVLLQVKQSQKTAGLQVTQQWAASAYYNVDHETESSNPLLATTQETAMQRLAATYSRLIQSDMCNQYVYERIKQDMPIEKFIERSQISTTAENFNLMKLGSLVKCNILEKTTTLNLFVVTKDKELSQTVLQYYMDYMSDVLEPSVKEDSLTYLGGATQVIESENVTIFEKGPITVAIMGILGLLFFALFVLCYSFFRPTINRKSDFAQYDIDVIAQL